MFLTRLIGMSDQQYAILNLGNNNLNVICHSSLLSFVQLE
jgi:hypothetical protein